MITDGYSAEKESANCAEMKKLQTGDVSYEENSAAAATRARLEVDGVSAEKSLLTSKVSLSECYLASTMLNSRWMVLHVSHNSR